METQEELRCIALSPPGITDARIPIAASRAKGIGILDLGSVRNSRTALEWMADFRQAGGKNCGVRISTGQLAALEIPSAFDTVILRSDEGVDLTAAVRALKRPNRSVLLEATSLELANCGEVAGVDGVIAKGNEAGGWVGDETTFI